MTDTPYSDELDEILMKLARNTTLADRAAGVASTVSTLKDASKIFDWSISEAKQAIEALIDKKVNEVLDRVENKILINNQPDRATFGQFKDEQKCWFCDILVEDCECRGHEGYLQRNVEIEEQQHQAIKKLRSEL